MSVINRQQAEQQERRRE